MLWEYSFLKGQVMFMEALKVFILNTIFNILSFQRWFQSSRDRQAKKLARNPEVVKQPEVEPVNPEPITPGIKKPQLPKKPAFRPIAPSGPV